MIRLDAVSRRFGDLTAVDRLTLEVGAGELVCLVGGSGSGKSTTLRMINRLIEPSAGRIWVEGRDHRADPVWQLRRRIGFVFQETALFPHRTVGANVGLGLELAGWTAARRERRVAELLELVQLDPARFAGRSSRELSGGERQRVGLARALATEPRVVLLDEPFAALDPATRDDLQQAYLAIHRRLGLTALFVTHDMSEALLLADRVAVVSRGRLLQVGTPAELLRRPANPYVERLLSTPRRQAAAIEALLPEEAP